MKAKLTYAQFNVESESGDDDYLIAYDNEEGWYCNCPDRHYRKHECKHIKQVKNDLRKGRLVVEEVIPETQTRLVI